MFNSFLGFTKSNPIFEYPTHLLYWVQGGHYLEVVQNTPPPKIQTIATTTCSIIIEKTTNSQSFLISELWLSNSLLLDTTPADQLETPLELETTAYICHQNFRLSSPKSFQKVLCTTAPISKSYRPPWFSANTENNASAQTISYAYIKENVISKDLSILKCYQKYISDFKVIYIMTSLVT